MKLRFSIAGVFAAASIATAQQDPQFSMNMFNRLAVNPGYAGTSNAICGTGIYRNQWLGFEGAPRTFVLGVDLPVKAIRGGAGLTLMSDNIGVESNVYAKLAYSYHLKVAKGTLGLGLDLGMMNKSLGSGLNPLQPNDPSIPTSTQSATVFDAGLGVYYTDNRIYAGISSTHLPQSTFDLGTSQFTSRRHYYLMAGYRHELNPDIAIVPSVFLKNAVSTQLDVNCNVHYKNKLWGGLTYRLQDAFIIMAGMEVIKNGRLGLAYDINTSALNPYNNGTLELMFNYCFTIKTEKPPQTHSTVRYL